TQRLSVSAADLVPALPRARRRALAGPASVAGRDAKSRMACIAAAYPAAKASRRTSSICCCNSLTAVLAISRAPHNHPRVSRLHFLDCLQHDQLCGVAENSRLCWFVECWLLRANEEPNRRKSSAADWLIEG